MSTQSNVGSEVAAAEIAEAIRKELRGSVTQETREALERVLRKCEEIISSAKSGWY